MGGWVEWLDWRYGLGHFLGGKSSGYIELEQSRSWAGMLFLLYYMKSSLIIC